MNAFIFSALFVFAEIIAGNARRLEPFRPLPQPLQFFSWECAQPTGVPIQTREFSMFVYVATSLPAVTFRTA